MRHTVIAGRLYFLAPGADPLQERAELAGIAENVVTTYRDEEFPIFVVPSAPTPPLAIQFAGLPAGHPDPETLEPLAQTARQDQVQRILDAASLVDQGPLRYLHQAGRLYLVDDGELFVADTDQVLRAAIAARLSRGGLQDPRPAPIIPALTTAPRITRVLPVGND